VSLPLAALEEIIDASGIAPRIEALLPAGVRHRQLRVRTLLAGMLLSQADQRPAHLTRVRDALTALPGSDQIRLGVTEDWKTGPHLLTYRQTERTFGLVTGALAKDVPDGLPSDTLAAICNDLLEASILSEHKQASSSLAVDWTDVETFSRPPSRGSSDCADPEASWGHRSGGGPGQDSELFFGYYASAATMMPDEHGPPVPELARRMTVCSCHHDPARAPVPVLTAMPAAGIPLGDILADSGYAHRDAAAWAIPLRGTGAQLVQDLHPLDRGPRGTHHGAIIANGNLYCPATPRTLLELGPLARDATPDQVSAHDQQSAELARHKLGRITSDDADGYHRVMCPATMGKIRCPLRPASMTLTRDRPEILTPPEHPPGLLRPADHHRLSGRGRQDPAKTRLPLGGAPAVLRPAHRRRADLRHRQGPRQQQHRPRLDPAHGPDPAHALADLPARRPQQAHPGRLDRPPRRQRPPRRRRPPPENPQTPPQDPHHARNPAAITSSAQPLTRHCQPQALPPPPHRVSIPATSQNPPASRRQGTPDTTDTPTRPERPRMSDQKVNMVPTET